MSAPTERYVVPPELDGWRIDRALSELMGDVSRSAIQRWIAEQGVTLNGGECRARDMVRAGDVLVVRRGAALPSKAEPDPSVVVDVLYEDDALVVVSKPAGLVVHPARGHWHGTLVNGLLALPGFCASSDPADAAGGLRPGIVHRLDKETSGVLVVAKTDAAREGLKNQLQSHRMEREYLAITLGATEAGTIRTLHGRDPRSRLRFSSQVREGKQAVTHIAKQEQLPGATVVRCRLETGRTHQIRVHLAIERKTPVFGDALYGRAPHDPELKSLWEGLGRHALHAGVLGFVHPSQGRLMRFEAPLPDDLKSLWAALSALPRARA